MGERDEKVKTLIIKSQELVDTINSCGGFCDCPGHDESVVEEVRMALRSLEDE